MPRLRPNGRRAHKTQPIAPIQLGTRRNQPMNHNPEKPMARRAHVTWEACYAACNMLDFAYIDIRLPTHAYHPELYDPSRGLVMAVLNYAFGFTYAEIGSYIKRSRETVHKEIAFAIRWIRRKKALLDFFIMELSPLKPLSI